MIAIRPYKFIDYEMLSTWWLSADMTPPEEKMMRETSYVLEKDGTPVLSASLFLTNGPIAWIDNFIGNPNTPIRETKSLLRFLSAIADFNKKDRMFCMSVNKKTDRLYEFLGFNKTAEEVSTFILPLKGEQ